MRSDGHRRAEGLSEATVDARAVVEPKVSLGPGTVVGPFCQFKGRVSIGGGCRFFAGVVVGAEPMDRGYQGEETEVVVGKDNTFREYSTVHRSTGPGTATVVGDNNYVMAYVHIAHNCKVGNGCVIANGTQLAGHVEVGDRAYLGGLVGIHQHCRIGELAMVGAGSYVTKDIPPYSLVQGQPCRVRGLNAVGLARAGVSVAARAALKRGFKLIYRSGLNLSQALVHLDSLILASEPGAGLEELEKLVRFIRSSRRGIELREGKGSIVQGLE